MDRDLNALHAAPFYFPQTRSPTQTQAACPPATNLQQPAILIDSQKTKASSLLAPAGIPVKHRYTTWAHRIAQGKGMGMGDSLSG
jgi:hypothetical protein